MTGKRTRLTAGKEISDPDAKDAHLEFHPEIDLMPFLSSTRNLGAHDHLQSVTSELRSDWSAFLCSHF